MATPSEGGTLPTHGPAIGAIGFSVLSIGLAGALLAAFAFPDFRIVPIASIDLDDIPKALAVLFFFALVLERATEVYVNGIIEPERTQTDKRVDLRKQQLERAKEHYERISVVSPDSLRAGEQDRAASELTRATQALQEVEAAHEQVEARLSSKTRRHTSVILTLLGVATAVAGVRAIVPFLGDAAAIEALSGRQLLVMTGVDVFVTAALLGGGASGIHQISKRFAAFLETK